MVEKNVKDVSEETYNWRRQLKYGLVLVVVGVILNIAGSKIPGILGVPLFLDNVGTIITSVIGGYLPGVIMGYISNLINSTSDPATSYYCIITVLIAVVCTWLSKRGFFDKWYRLIVVILALTLLGGGLGSILTWLLYGYGMGEGISAPFTRQLYENGTMPLFWAQFISDLTIDLVDKTVTVIISVCILHFIPKSVRRRFRIDGWRQRPLSEKERVAAARTYSRRFSLRPKILTLVAVAIILIAIVTTGISLFLYHQTVVTGVVMEEIRFVSRIIALFFGFLPSTTSYFPSIPWRWLPGISPPIRRKSVSPVLRG